MNLPKEFGAVLSNKYVLYVVAFLAVTNVIGYIAVQDFNSLLFFVLIGYLASYFSKNMTVVLLSALVLTNLLMSTRRIQIREGMTSGSSAIEQEEDEGKNGPIAAASPVEEGESDDIDEGEEQVLSGNETPEIDVGELSPAGLAEGMKQMGGKNIVEQQKLIKKNLEELKPMLNTAKEMMETLKGAKSMISQFGGLSDMLPGM